MTTVIQDEDITFFSLDVGVKFTLPLASEETGEPFDLTGFTAQLFVNGLSPLAMVVEDPPSAGVVSYTVLTPGTIPVGTHRAQVKVTSDLHVFRSDEFNLVSLDSVLTP